jgi:hypothetical protein
VPFTLILSSATPSPSQRMMLFMNPTFPAYPWNLSGTYTERILQLCNRDAELLKAKAQGQQHAESSLQSALVAGT